MRCYRFYSFSIALFCSLPSRNLLKRSVLPSLVIHPTFHSHVICLIVDPYQSLVQAGQTNTAPAFNEVLAGAYKSVGSKWNYSIWDAIISLSKKRYPILRALGIYKLSRLKVVNWDRVNCSVGKFWLLCKNKNPLGEKKKQA